MAIIKIPVVKAKGKFVEVDSEAIPVEMYQAALEAGLKVLLNGGTSKITSTTYPNPEELASAALAKANERLAEMNAGTLKIGRKAAASKISGALRTEAMRLARALIKDTMREQGLKISHYKASEITAAAKEVLEADDDTAKALLAKAQETIDARKGILVKIDLGSKMHVDPELVKKAEAKKKPAAEGQLSAAKAGQVTKRAKGGGASATQH